MIRFLLLTFVVLLTGNTIQKLSLNWFASSFVSSIPVLGDIFTVSDITFIFTTLNAQTVSEMDIKTISAIILKIFGIAINLVAWILWYVTLEGGKAEIEAQNNKSLAPLTLAIKIIILAMANLLYSFLLIALLHQNILEKITNWIMPLFSKISL
ncbi:hypothetical protein COE12_03540 [Bacillus anthracis]|nr:hypothetical protein COE12_03540 [Bacillus anthracis]